MEYSELLKSENQITSVRLKELFTRDKKFRVIVHSSCVGEFMGVVKIFKDDSFPTVDKMNYYIGFGTNNAIVVYFDGLDYRMSYNQIHEDSENGIAYRQEYGELLVFIKDENYYSIGI